MEGARSLGAAEIRRLLAVEPGRDVDTTLFAAAAERLVGALRNEGYFDARVTLDWSGDRMTVRVDEGDPWTIAAADYFATSPLDSAAVAAVVRLRPGDRFRRGAVDRDLDAILDLYDESGHPYARLRPVRFDAAGGQVRFRVEHDPGPLVRIESLELDGAVITKSSTVERVLDFHSGRPYRQSAIEDGLDRLRLSGLFADVSGAELLPGIDPAHSRLRIRVREASAGSLTGIVGYSGRDKRLEGDLNIRLRNIAGTGRALNARWSAREKASTLYALGYREPWLFGRPVDLAFDLEHVLFDTLYTRTRIDVTLEWRPMHRVRISGGFGRDRAVVTSALRRSEGSLRILGGLSWDARDSRHFATRGLLLDARVERGKTLSGTFGDREGALLESLTRMTARGELYRGAAGRSTLALIVTGRALETRALPVPQYELFPLGGAVSLRGYREEQFYTPAYVLSQFEFRLPAGEFGTGAYLFLDSAFFARAGDPADLPPALPLTKVGYGAGIRVGSRAGRVGVDYGLAAGEGPLDGRIHLRLEAEF